MTSFVDSLIDQMDAVMCGAEPGAVPLPAFDDATLGQLRGILMPAVADCRVCMRFSADRGGLCTIPSHCTQGDKFVRVKFEPLWRVPS